MAFNYLIENVSNIDATARNSSPYRGASTTAKLRQNAAGTQAIVPYSGATKPTGLTGTSYTWAQLKSHLASNRATWGIGANDWDATTLGAITTPAIVTSGASNGLRIYAYIDDDNYDSSETYKLKGLAIHNETTDGYYSLGTVDLSSSSVFGGVRILQTVPYNVTSSASHGAAHNNNGGTNDYRAIGVISSTENEYNQVFLTASTRSLTNVTK